MTRAPDPAEVRAREVLAAIRVERRDFSRSAMVTLETAHAAMLAFCATEAPPVAGMGEGLVKRLKLAVDRFHASPSWPFDGSNIADLEKLLAALTKPTPPAGVSGSEADPVIMIEVESAYDRHTYTFTSRAESDAFLAGARQVPGISVTAIDERNVATAEYALGGLPEMLEAQDD